MYPVSVKGVLFDPQGRCVLALNDRDEWELPGGRIEIGETPETCLAREFHEELGIAVEAGELLDSYLFEVIPGRHVFIVTYACRCDTAFAPRLSEEHLRVDAFAPSALPENLPDGYKRSILRWQAMLGRADSRPAVRLRPATIADLPTLRHWDEQDHVIESDPNDDWGWETELLRTPAWREQLIAEADGRSIGFVQIIDPALEDSHYWGEVAANLRAIDIWIGEADDLGRGYGTQMMWLALERCFAAPDVGAVLIDPLADNVRALAFYPRFGFEAVGLRQFGLDECLVHLLSRETYEMARRRPA